MAVYKRGNIYWYSFVFDGRRVQRSTKVENKNDARDIERAAWTQLARAEVGLPALGPKREPPTIGELFDALEKDFKLRGKSDAKNQSNLKRARAVFPEKMKAASLTSVHVDAYIEKKTHEGTAPATINRMLQLVGQAYKKGIERGEIDRAPRLRHLSEAGNERKGFFSDAGFRAVHAHLPEDLRDFALFGYLTGWRKNEIASLTWSDVEENVIRLRGENSKNGEGRSIVIAGELVGLMERRQQARLADGVLTRLVFHRDGAPVREFRKSWASACDKVNLSGRLFHDLRRTAVRNMVRSGVPQNVAMKISGHKTASMFRRYDIANEDDLRQAIEAVQRYHEAAQRKVVSMKS